jgi:hypothetical protein
LELIGNSLQSPAYSKSNRAYLPEKIYGDEQGEVIPAKGYGSRQINVRRYLTL